MFGEVAEPKNVKPMKKILLNLIVVHCSLLVSFESLFLFVWFLFKYFCLNLISSCVSVKGSLDNLFRTWSPAISTLSTKPFSTFSRTNRTFRSSTRRTRTSRTSRRRSSFYRNPKSIRRNWKFLKKLTQFWRTSNRDLQRGALIRFSLSF